MKKPASVLDNLTDEEMAAVITRIIELRTKVFSDTQAEFAERLKVSQSYISLLEAGRKPLTKAAFENIVSVLGITPEWLLYGSTDIMFKDRSEDEITIDRFLKWYDSLPIEKQASLASCMMQISDIAKDYPPGS